jgi:divalent metal cation (Fe/Co/Zn/Cd) transporter
LGHVWATLIRAGFLVIVSIYIARFGIQRRGSDPPEWIEFVGVMMLFAVAGVFVHSLAHVFDSAEAAREKTLAIEAQKSPK